MALTDKLTAIGDAVRQKSGTTEKMTLDQMATAVNELSVGPTDEDLTFSGDLLYFNYKGRLNKILKKYGNRITFKNVDDFSHAFSFQGQEEELPYVFSGDGIRTNLQDMFSSSTKLKKIGELKNIVPYNLTYVFYDCRNLRELPKMTDWDFTYFHQEPYANFYYMFNNCYSLRKVPPELLKELWSGGTDYISYVLYENFSYCYALDELRDLPLGDKSLTYDSNRWSAPYYLYHIKDILFETQEDGTPYTLAQNNMTIYLRDDYGWCPPNDVSSLLNYNSGITKDKEVNSAETYQALKNDPDWYSTSKDYSRYNRQSAINTIATLPDTSAYLTANGGTNTIKFPSGLGKLTDAGGVDTLTPEEIAVATAKGWTVSYS